VNRDHQIAAAAVVVVACCWLLLRSTTAPERSATPDTIAAGAQTIPAADARRELTHLANEISQLQAGRLDRRGRADLQARFDQATRARWQQNPVRIPANQPRPPAARISDLRLNALPGGRYRMTFRLGASQHAFVWLAEPHAGDWILSESS